MIHRFRVIRQNGWLPARTGQARLYAERIEPWAPLAPKIAPALYPRLQPYGRIGVNYQLGDAPGHSRPTPAIRSACGTLTFAERAPVAPVDHNGARNTAHGSALCGRHGTRPTTG